MSLPPSLEKAMTPFPHFVAPDALAESALDLMNERSVHHLPVVTEHRIVGIVTPTDIMAAQAKARDGDDLRVSERCGREVYVVVIEKPLEAVLLTLANRLADAAIVTRHGRLAGVFTAIDACRSFGQYLAENFPHGGDNEAA